MNARLFKKKCKQAMLELVDRHGYKQHFFERANGQETLNSDRRLDRKFHHHWRGRRTLFMSPPKGCYVYWDVFDGEGDCYTALEILDRVRADEKYIAEMDAKYAAEGVPQ